MTTHDINKFVVYDNDRMLWLKQNEWVENLDGAEHFDTYAEAICMALGFNVIEFTVLEVKCSVIP